MSIFDIFKSKKQARSAAMIAKERLQIVVSHRSEQKDPGFIQKLHAELIEVISKYVKIDPHQIKVQLGESGDCSTLELNVTLPKEGEVVAAEEQTTVNTEVEQSAKPETKETQKKQEVKEEETAEA